LRALGHGKISGWLAPAGPLALGKSSHYWIEKVRDVFDPNTLQQQWTAFTNAPFIMLPLIAIAASGAASAGWWLRGTTSAGKIAGLEGKIAGLEAQNAALDARNSVTEQRLKLAAEQLAVANEAKNDVETRFRALEMAIASKADVVSLSALAAEVKTEFAKLTAANNAVRSTVSAVLEVTDAHDVIRATIEN
jgi:hypothetical protein